MDPSTSSGPPLVRKRPRRRRRRLLVALVLLVVVFGVGVLIFIWTASSELTRLLAEMDLLDPGWRLEDIEAKRKVIPDANNSALHILTIKKLRGSQGVLTNSIVKIFDNLPPQVQLNKQQTGHLDKRFEILRKAVMEARKLHDMPDGRFPVTYSADFFGTMSTTIVNYQDVREVCELLQWDAARRVQASDVDGAMESCLAIHHAARSVRDEPFLISFLVHCACDAVAVAAMERTLAQGYFTEASAPTLKRVQDALAKESREPTFRAAVRGERAGSHQYFQALAEGNATGISRNATGVSLVDHVVVYFTRQHVAQLRFYNDALEVLKLPSEKWKEGFGALEKNAHDMPPINKIAESELRRQASLRSAVAALAAERFRLSRKHWPGVLDDLVKAGFLEAAPTDPFDGKQLPFKRTADGLVIYSVGHDRIDDGGNIDRDNPMTPGTDVGFRLWDDDRRRQPPNPPVAEGETAEP